MATVLDAWQTEAVGNPLFLFVRKLANVKKALKLWNSEVFGPIHLKLSVSKKELEDAQSRLQQLPTDPIYIAEEADARSTYLSLLSQEEKFARQKSRQLWLTAGDSNTKFFYNSIKSRSVMNSISRLRREDNSLCSDPEEIKSLIVQYYQNLLNREATSDLQLPPPPGLVSPTENLALCSPVSEKELRSVIFGLKALSSPGPDGFPARFFQLLWDLIKLDLLQAINHFFLNGKLLRQVNHSFIALIPKTLNADSLDLYRPISLCNTLYKIITRIMALRIQPLLPKLVSKHQSA
ncbi:hypothetical protein QJS10_CPB04g01586 [Acorus calamus]|uniref:Reverse transcriptase domain-containing protein n=1 Tax=Acorus calamus TaxID=4465 RepID=A0AAV9F0Z9_ACOCL|nr:hypothetical protein QJS10_CPB04g01586 [Acorus calamus]